MMKFQRFHRIHWVLLSLLVTATGTAAPLHDAARSGDIKQVQRLIDAGANVNSQDRYGLTPLLIATGNGHDEVARLLRRSGAGDLILPEAMTQIQIYLKALGHDPGSIDGLIGPGTRDAIRAYQRQKNLPLTGRLSEDWIVQLNRDVVQDVQLRLLSLGYSPGNTDGLISADTENAIREFQKQEQLPVTGQFSEDWFNRLLAKSDSPAVTATAEDTSINQPALLTLQAEPSITMAEAPNQIPSTSPSDNPTDEPIDVALVDIQARLKLLGYYKGQADGLTGPGTERAIRAFQAAEGFPATGQLSQDWLLKLDHEILSAVQRQLNQLGYGDDFIEVRAGPATEKAIRTFQEQHDLPVTGQIGEDWAVLITQKAAEKAAAELRKQQISSARKLLEILGLLPNPASGDQLDAATQAAISSFQASANLAVTGEPSEELLTALNSEALRYVQTRLQILGYRSDPINGTMDNSTLSGIQAFQQSYDLPEIGALSSDWISKLNEVTLRHIQTRLQILGFGLGKDGSETNLSTRNAIHTFQEKAGLPVQDAIASDWVYQLEREALRHIQNRLQILGYNPGEFDGLMGPGTRNAIRAFQEYLNLPVTGEISTDWVIQLDIELLKIIQSRLKSMGYDENNSLEVAPPPANSSSADEPTTPAATINNEEPSSTEDLPKPQEPEASQDLDTESPDSAAAPVEEEAPNELVRLLRQNSTTPSAELIKLTQHRLQVLGFEPGSPDGHIGPSTEAAIRKFQKKTELPVTGQFSEDWLVALDDERLRTVQQRLAVLSYDVGPADGKVGTRTQNAIRAFQQNEKLPVTGEVSDELLSQIQVVLAAQAEREVAELKNAQDHLRVLGYKPGPSDGELGPSTQRAIRAFQKQAEITVTGTVSDQLNDQLRQELVLNVQKRLQQLGYDPGPADGEFGPSTQRAIQTFSTQTADLKSTNKASPALLAKLDETIAAQAAKLAAEKAAAEKAIAEKAAIAKAAAEKAAIAKAAAEKAEAAKTGTAQSGQNPLPVTVTTRTATKQTLSADKIAKVQSYLKVLGHDPGRSDGQLGARTQGAIRAFQAQADIPVTGAVSEQLYVMLSEMATSKAEAQRALNKSAQSSEISGAMRFQRTSGGKLLGCSVEHLELDLSWCSTFAARRNTENCKVVMRPNDSKVLFVKCV